MWRVAYVSRLVCRRSELIHILNVAGTHNFRASISGYLWFDKVTCTVAQILEGTGNSLYPLLRRILEDARHTSIAIILTEQASARRHQLCGMYVGTDALLSHEPIVRERFESRIHASGVLPRAGLANRDWGEARRTTPSMSKELRSSTEYTSTECGSDRWTS